jgi:mRNA interferase MazF
MSSRRFVPDRGDVIWIEMTPQAGHEQAGRRPALVLSPAAYNGKTGLALLCPITSQIKGYPFEVGLPAEANVTGVILSDQVRSLDWRGRNAAPQGRVATQVVEDVVARLSTLLGSSRSTD